MKKKDILLAVSVVVTALLLLLILKIPDSGAGGEIRITIDGSLYGTYSLQEDQTIEIAQESGTNIVYIRNGAAWMEEADCPDGYCIRQGRVSRTKQTIVCLPHKLVVEVTGTRSDETEEKEPAPDAVVH